MPDQSHSVSAQQCNLVCHPPPSTIPQHTNHRTRIHKEDSVFLVHKPIHKRHIHTSIIINYTTIMASDNKNQAQSAKPSACHKTLSKVIHTSYNSRTRIIPLYVHVLIGILMFARIAKSRFMCKSRVKCCMT